MVAQENLATSDGSSEWNFLGGGSMDAGSLRYRNIHWILAFVCVAACLANGLRSIPLRRPPSCDSLMASCTSYKQPAISRHPESLQTEATITVSENLATWPSEMEGTFAAPRLGRRDGQANVDAAFVSVVKNVQLAESPPPDANRLPQIASTVVGYQPANHTSAEPTVLRQPTVNLADAQDTNPINARYQDSDTPLTIDPTIVEVVRDELPDLPKTARPSPLWWREFIHGSILHRETVPLTTNQLAVETLEYSPTVSLLAARPQAVKTYIVEEAAKFDWNIFMESRWRDTTEPIGSSLTTGGPSIYRQHEFTNEGGVRRTNRIGGEVSVGQLFGYEQSNSQFFLPPNQGATTLTIDYSQPLLRGAGRNFNESPVVLATLASDSADLNFVSQLQDLLFDVGRNYWQLYLSRATLLIERRLYHRAAETLDILKKRESVDASKEMISRAELAIASRKARLINARRILLDQQSLLRSVVNSPGLDNPEQQEFVPAESPFVVGPGLKIADAFATAVQYRPEIANTLAQVRAANVRYDVAENELLPELNLVLQTYAQGLRGEFNLQDAFRDQFNGAEPSYSAGLMFQVPIGRRAANARLSRRQIEVGELTAQFRVELERILFDVVTQLRQLEATRLTLETNYEAFIAAAETLRLLETRYRLLSSEQNGAASLRLQDILNSHVRVSDTEIALVRSQVEHAIAAIRLRRTLGVLVRPGV